MNCFRSLYLWVDLQRAKFNLLASNGCELLSFFVPLGWFTASRLSGHPNPRLWIAFVLCTFGLIYSIASVVLKISFVVNCFRSLYLWVDLQQGVSAPATPPGCELLSFFVPLGWFTAFCKTSIGISLLWIAFVLCTFGLIYSLSSRLILQHSVVNCFRSLYLWVDLQPPAHRGRRLRGCELLSFFVPLGWFTASPRWPSSCRMLWIAFVLCTFGLIYSLANISDFIISVVNCFRSLYLWVDLQRTAPGCLPSARCELLSFFVPLGWFTAKRIFGILGHWLWIAFVLCTFGLIYSKCCQWAKRESLWIAFVLCTFGLIYSSGLTPYGKGMLWIAFVLCTFGLIYSPRLMPPFILSVVNCFRSLYLWVDLQQALASGEWRNSCELLSFFVPLGWFTASIYSLFGGCSCELLSFFVPLGWFTAKVWNGNIPNLLWIAFVLCTFGLIYSLPTARTTN